MFTPLPTPAEMNRWDSEAMTLGLPSLMLMENASREALHVLREVYAPHGGTLTGRRVWLFMGGGNNGGDAAALARHVLDAGADPLVIHTRPLDQYAETPAEHIRIAAACGVPFVFWETWKTRMSVSSLLHEVRSLPHILVDGLLGTGFHGPLRPVERELIESINALREHACIFALDIPSGLSGLDGRPGPEAVRAHATVTFEAAKPGLILPWARPFTGELYIRPIGIPARVREAHPASYRMLDETWASALPAPAVMAHKGLAGHVLVAGGSANYPGAAHLAALGALRTGAGLVSVAAPQSVIDAVRGGDPCLMPRSLPVDGWNVDAAEALRPHLAELAASRTSALVLGPGLGRDVHAAAFVSAVLAGPRPHTVLDADALFTLPLDSLRDSDVLTPHPGEAARILGCTTADVQADRFAAMARLTALAPCVWVLKGEGTLIGQHKHPTTIVPLHVPTLAVGGSGDVLSGCCAALLAQGCTALNAACLAVRLHCAAGEWLLAHTFPARGNSAAHIAEAIPHALARA